MKKIKEIRETRLILALRGISQQSRASARMGRLFRFRRIVLLVVTFLCLLIFRKFDTDVLLTINESARISRSTEFVFNIPELCSGVEVNGPSIPSSLFSSSSSAPLIVIIVTTAAHHQEHRKAIRSTWGNKERLAAVGVRIAFLFGAQSNDSLQRIIHSEARIHRDIIQSSAFEDTYMNLTLKSMSMLRWTSEFCPGVGYLFKADDDMFIRLDNLLSFIKKEGAALRSSIFGELNVGAPAIRNTSSKWFISEKEYNKRVYPNYISGTAYVISVPCMEMILRSWNHVNVGGYGSYLDFHFCKFKKLGLQNARNLLLYRSSLTALLFPN